MGFHDLKIKDEDFKGRNIQSLDTNIITGRAEEIKRLFDAPAQEVLKESINTILDYLMSAGAGAEIGTPELNEESGNTIAQQFSYLLDVMKGISAGSLPDGSVEDKKLSANRGQIRDSVNALKYILKHLQVYAPDNALVKWNSTVSGDESDQFFDYTKTDAGACFSEAENGELKFSTLPVCYGGTNNKNLTEAPDGAMIVKKKNENGESYLGYMNVVPVENGGTGATNAVTARANLGAAAADHTHDNLNVSMEFNTDKINKSIYNAQYSPITKCCFVRINVTTSAAFSADKSYALCTVPTQYIPAYRHALSYYGSKSALANISNDGAIYIRPQENIPEGYDLYISGYWIV